MPALDIRSPVSLLLPGKCLLLSEHELHNICIMQRFLLNSWHVKLYLAGKCVENIFNFIVQDMI